MTQDLLRFWFSDSFVETRNNLNFHEGQRQAILNTIYVHEVLKASSVFEMYEAVNASATESRFMEAADLSALRKDKYKHPKYCMKMATGTGKTWVLGALLIWQYLNARHEDERSGRYSKNFLVVAPGLIVYERLLDSYLGKERKPGRGTFMLTFSSRASCSFPTPIGKRFWALCNRASCEKKKLAARSRAMA